MDVIKRDKKLASKKIIIITEANDRVASGHLLESIELLHLLRNRKLKADLYINDDSCKGFKDRINTKFYEYHLSVEEDSEFLCNVINKNNYDVIITDLRSVSDDWICRIRKETGSVIICIDEWGHRKLSCDVVINPMIDSYYWDYEDSSAVIYTGHDYLILPHSITKYHMMKKRIHKSIKRICISMGGVDKFETTNKLLFYLISEYPELTYEVIIGAGFAYKENLDRIVENNKNITVMQNVSNIYEYFYRADIAFCAGGNTLHELACIGTPTIVVPSMDHEYSNGKTFEKMGFGVTTSKADIFNDSEIKEKLKKINSIDVRRSMSESGKAICKGEGGNLVSEIVVSYSK